MEKIEQKNIRFNLELSDHRKAYENVNSFDRSRFHSLSNYIVYCLNKLAEIENTDSIYVTKKEFQNQVELLENRIFDLHYCIAKSSESLEGEEEQSFEDAELIIQTRDKSDEDDESETTRLLNEYINQLKEIGEYIDYYSISSIEYNDEENDFEFETQDTELSDLLACCLEDFGKLEE